MKKYKASTSSWRGEITEVEVERETKDFVIINGRRDGKKTSYCAYFDTYAEAWAYLHGIYDDNIKLAASRMEYEIKMQSDFIAKYPPIKTDSNE